MSKQHVFLEGTTLGNLSSNEIKTILDECVQVKPIHVKKGNVNASFCHLHFAMCSRLGKCYIRKAYDFKNKEVEYNVDLVEDSYHDSCICQSTDMTHTSSGKNSDNDRNVISFYTERKEHLVAEIERREKALSRKRQEMEDEELIVLKRRKELNLLNEIINLWVR